MSLIRSRQLPEIIESQALDGKFVFINNTILRVNKKQHSKKQIVIGSKIAFGVLSVASLMIAIII